MDNRAQVIQRLQELRQEHEAAVGEGPGEAPGFIQDEQNSRESYRLVLEDALNSGMLTRDELELEGLPEELT